MNTTISFNNIITELAASASALLEETNIAFEKQRISEEEYSGYVDLQSNLCDLMTDFNIGEVSPNAFLRSLYYITKSFERLGDTTYTKSMYDLLADTYIELAEINLHRK